MTNEEKAITEVLAAQSRAWNSGVLECFMEAYQYSPDILYVSGGKYKRGWHEIQNCYQERYFHDGSDAGQLSTGIIEIKMISTNVAIVCGFWKLLKRSGEKSEGLFSLVMQNINNQWKITHDHSS